MESGRRLPRAATLVLLLLLIAAAAADETTASSRTHHHGNALIEWLRNDCRGYFNPKIEIRQVMSDDENSKNVYYGMFASQDLKEDEILMEIPRECVLTPRKGHVGDRIASFFGEENEKYYTGVITAVYPVAKEDAQDERRLVALRHSL